MLGKPVPTNDKRGLGYSDAIVGTIMALYSPTLWHHLTDGLSELVGHHGDTLRAGRHVHGSRLHGHYSNATDARVAIKSDRHLLGTGPRSSTKTVDPARSRRS